MRQMFESAKRDNAIVEKIDQLCQAMERQIDAEDKLLAELEEVLQEYTAHRNAQRNKTGYILSKFG